MQQRIVRDSRRAGTGLTVFGVVGAILGSVTALAFLAGAVATADLGGRLESAGARLEETLRDASFSVGRAALATADLGATVGSSEQVLRDTSALLAETSTAVDAVADAIDIAILGQRPLAEAAAQLRAVADDLDATSESTNELAIDLVSNANDLEAIEAELRDLQASLDDAAEQLDVGPQIGRLVGLLAIGLVVLAALAAWIAIAGGLVAWLGSRLRGGALGSGPSSAA
jgi:hypothetical protein